MASKTIEQVRRENTDEWLAIPGVAGTAIGLHEGKECIKVYLSEKAPQQASIPSSVAGYRVILEETGEFQALK